MIEDDSNKQIKWLAICTGVILLARVLIIPFSGTMPQDAYYYMYSKHFSLSYFDHPAGIAVVIKIGTFLLGNHPAAIIFSMFLVTLLSLFVIYNLAVQFFTKRQSLLFIMVLASTPMFGILAWIATPDVPLILFWSLSLLLIYKADQKNNLWLWALAGLSSGLAFCSKYTAVFIVAGLFLWLFSKPDRWKRIFSKATFIYLLLFGVGILPVIIWNMQHLWASINFQTSSRMQEASFTLKPTYPPAVLLLQVFLLLPWLFYFFIRSFNLRQASPNRMFLHSFSFPLFFSFLLVSFFYWVKINWMMPAFITGSLLAFHHFSLKHIRWHIITSVLFFLMAFIEVLFYPVQIKSHDTWWGWKEIAYKTTVLKEQSKAHFIFSTDDYKTSAELRLYMQQPVYGLNVIGEPALEFDYIGEDVNAWKHTNALYVTDIPSLDEKATNDELNRVKKYFGSVTPLETLVVMNRFGKVSRMVKYYYCKDYKGLPPLNSY